MKKATNLSFSIIIPALIICSFSSQIAFSQVDFHRFPLDSFKLPNIDRRTLDFTGSLNSNYSNYRFENQDPTSSFNPQAGLTYSKYINRPDLQATLFASANQEFNAYQKQSGPFNSIRSGNDFYQSFDISGNWKRYKGKSFFVTDLDAYLSYSFGHKITVDTIEYNTKQNNIRLTLSPSIGFGKGRLELVSDLPTAMFLLKDAVDIGLDGSSITTTDIYEFASLMATLRNKRIFDSRRKRVQELRELYNFMLLKNWTLPDDPGFFTVLTDNWTFNYFYTRYSGSRWTYLLTPFFYHSSFNGSNNLTSESRTDELGAVVSVEYTRHKPISLFKDNIHTHVISANVTNNKFDGGFFNESETWLQVKFGNSFGKNWYPNNRASIFCALTADYFYYRMLSPSAFSINQDQNVISLGLKGNCIYYLSYKTRLVADALISYAEFGEDQVPNFHNFDYPAYTDGLQLRFNASFVVSIF